MRPNKSMIPKSCRLFGQDHAADQIPGANSRFNRSHRIPSTRRRRASSRSAWDRATGPVGRWTGVYFLDEDGHRAFAQDLAAADDREAVKKARQLLDRQDVELWDGERLVGRFDHDRPWTE